jgi:hypothetical protein
MSDPKPTHPSCPICDVPMWLTRVELGDLADNQQFECKVCDRKTRRIVQHEQHAQAVF